MAVVDVSVVVPTYRGEKSLRPLVEGLHEVLEEIGTFEIIVVNDGSPDDTWPALLQLASQFPQLLAIDLLHNRGQPMATMCGLEHSSGRVVVAMDDDLQHPPGDIPNLLRALDEHPDWDAVVGSWQRDEGGWRNVGSRIHALADKIAWGTPTDFHHTAFRAIRRQAVDALVANETRAPVVGPLLTRSAGQVHNIEVRHDDRRIGSSNFTFISGAKRVIANFAQGSVAPLNALTVFGFITALGSFLATLYFLTRWALGANSPAGWLSAFLATLFFGGSSLLGLGIIGQYIQYLVREVRGDPRWAIRRTANGAQDGAEVRAKQ